MKPQYTKKSQYKWWGVLGLVMIVAIVMTSCGRATTTPAPQQETLTIYSGRSEGLVKPIIDQFSKSTGINVQVRYAGTSELATTILEEGKNSPADIFYAQDPGGIGAPWHIS